MSRTWCGPHDATSTYYHHQSNADNCQDISSYICVSPRMSLVHCLLSIYLNLDSFRSKDVSIYLFLSIGLICLSPGRQPSIHLYLWLSVCPPIYSIYLLLTFFISIYVSICPLIYVSNCQYVYQSIYSSIYLSVCLSTFLSICLSVCISHIAGGISSACKAWCDR